MNLLFSIIIPAYNASKYIDECISSIINQTSNNYELIIIDDGSTDNTLEICNRFAKKNDRIKVIHQDNKGVSITRARGVEEAKGEYIVFCDSDDMLHSETLKYIENVINNYKTDVIAFGVTSNSNLLNCSDNGKFYNKEDIEKIIYPYLLENKYGKYFSPSIWGGAFKKSLYIENQVQNCKIEIGEDLACKKAVIFNANSLYIMNAVFYFYRKNNFSVTQSKKVFLWDGPQLIGEHLEEKIDINKFDMQQQLYRVITHQLFLVAKTQFNRKEKYFVIKKDIIDNISNDYYLTAINNCNYSWKNFKGNLAKFALKYRLIFLIYIFSKIN